MTTEKRQGDKHVTYHARFTRHPRYVKDSILVCHPFCRWISSTLYCNPGPVVPFGYSTVLRHFQVLYTDLSYKRLKRQCCDQLWGNAVNSPLRIGFSHLSVLYSLTMPSSFATARTLSVPFTAHRNVLFRDDEHISELDRLNSHTWCMAVAHCWFTRREL